MGISVGVDNPEIARFLEFQFLIVQFTLPWYPLSSRDH